MNIENIKVGDKFSTEQKLLQSVGYDKAINSKQKKYQLRELNRYLTYEKTGKISRGKVTNEIIITQIFNIPKDKIDDRKDNGGNNSGIITKYIYNWIVDKLNFENEITSGKTGIIRQTGLIDNEFSDLYYNFDNRFSHMVNGEKENYTDIEKEFFLDYCDRILNSYKTRLDRILKSFGNQISIETYYQINCLKDNKNEIENIKDKETINKINKVKENLESLYGVNENSDKWKLYGNRTKANNFHNDFIKQVKIMLKDNTIENCYEVLHITANERLDGKGVIDYESYRDLYQAQTKLVDDKLYTTFNIKRKIYDSYKLEFVKVPKYNHNDISDDLIQDCRDMVDVGIDKETGEVYFE